MENIEVFPLHSDDKPTGSRPLLNQVEKILENKYSEYPFKHLNLLKESAFKHLSREFLQHYSAGDFVNLLDFIRSEITAYAADPSDRLKIINPDIEDTQLTSSYTILNLVCPNLPFVIDSIHGNLAREKVEVQTLFYESFDYTYENDQLTELVPSEDEDALLLVHVQLNRLNKDEIRELERLIQEILTDIRLAVSDFESMIENAEIVSDKLSSYREILPDQEELLLEAKRLINYLVDENFVFLGYREYGLECDENGCELLKTVGQSNLGILQTDRFKDYPDQIPVTKLDYRVQERVTSRMILTVKKTEVESLVYRREQLDHVTVKNLDSDGEIIGEFQFVGLFTDRVLNEPAVNIPLLRKKFQDMVQREKISRHTSLYRDFYNIFNNMPKHVLFSSSMDELSDDIHAVIEAYGETGFKLRARPDAYRQGLTIMIIIPRERYSEQVSSQIESELQTEFEPAALDYRVAFGESDFVQLHYYLHTDRRSPKTCSFEELEEKLRTQIRSWKDRLIELLKNKYEPQQRSLLIEKYGSAFPDEYKALISPHFALKDIVNVEKLLDGETPSPQIDLLPNEKDENTSRLIFYSNRHIKLNEIMPLLSNHGLQIMEQSTFQLKVNGERLYLYLFIIEEPPQSPVSFERRRQLLIESIDGVYRGYYRDDIVNELVARRGLAPRAVNLFRLYKNYFHQINPTVKLESINRTLVKFLHISELLFRYFEIKFDPDEPDDHRKQELKAQEKSILKLLENIEDRNDDYILRSLLNLIKSTVRTNYYQENCSKPYISIKIESAKVQDMPDPRPLYEFYVYSTEMEAIHLRHDKIARGGIRWSDRRDDYRTEVLDLVKTQKVKNSLIVPGGAKGGFIIKQEHIEDEKSLAEQARQKYKNFMRGMLDLTDNLVDEEPVAPEDVVCYDDPDPYLVVAADKGTAQFSDLANSVSQDYGFWLDDAFATGGETGYNHKEQGITAKGTWVCVERHFQELGKDIEQPFSVAGIGDMSGDVFGNGMLLSDKIRLLGSFNHRFIFLDPGPDPDTSFEERKRLYAEEADWDKYDKSLISDGGGVFRRDVRTIDLPEKSRQMLNIETDEPTPEEVIKALLKLDVDLLFNGGIGTYIKASGEAHSDAGDPTNDNCRVDADQVNADVIGEGGNLGITQRGRIELARNGIRLNTDAIDNSGGVDMSDHEVNIKILLQESIRRNELDPAQRVDVLKSLDELLVDFVTANNYSQSGAISLETHNSELRLDDYRHLLKQLERDVKLDREVEDLPYESEMLERLQAGRGMVRPEIAVMLSYAKMALRQHLSAEDWSEDWLIKPFLHSYFPDKLVEEFPQGMNNHPLKKEIALTELVNHLVDTCGLTFFFRLSEETGAEITELTRWFLVSERLTGASHLFSTLSQLEEELEAEIFYQTWWKILVRLDTVAGWLHNSFHRHYSPAEFEQMAAPQLEKQRRKIHSQLSGSRLQRINEKKERWKKLGADETFVTTLADLYYLIPDLDVIFLANQEEKPVDEIAQFYFELGSLLNIDWILGRLIHQRSHDHWEEMAISSLTREINFIHRDIARTLLENSTSIEDFHSENENPISCLNSIQEDLENTREFNFAGYQFYVQRLRQLK